MKGGTSWGGYYNCKKLANSNVGWVVSNWILGVDFWCNKNRIFQGCKLPCPLAHFKYHHQRLTAACHTPQNVCRLQLLKVLSNSIQIPVALLRNKSFRLAFVIYIHNSPFKLQFWAIQRILPLLTKLGCNVRQSWKIAIEEPTLINETKFPLIRVRAVGRKTS